MQNACCCNLTRVVGSVHEASACQQIWTSVVYNVGQLDTHVRVRISELWAALTRTYHRYCYTFQEKSSLAEL